MASTTDAIILDGLCTHLAGLTLSTPLTVAWPDVDFTPPAAGYVRVTFLPNETMQSELGDAGRNRHMGLFQVSVMWPEGNGSVTPTDLAGEIVAHFKRGTVITHDGLIIHIDRPPYISPRLKDSPYTQYPVTVSYRSDNANP